MQSQNMTHTWTEDCVSQARMRHFTTCLSEGMKKCMVKPVNYDKVWDITQGKRKLSSLSGPGDSGIQRGHQYRPWFHRREDTAGHELYHPGYSWHTEKTTKAWGWAWNAIVNLIDEAFKVYNNQDLTEETSKDKRLMKKKQLWLLKFTCHVWGTQRGEKTQQTAKKPRGLKPVCLLSKEGPWKGQCPEHPPVGHSRGTPNQLQFLDNFSN